MKWLPGRNNHLLFTKVTKLMCKQMYFVASMNMIGIELIKSKVLKYSFALDLHRLDLTVRKP